MGFVQHGVCPVWGVYSVGMYSVRRVQCGACIAWGVYSVGCVQCGCVQCGVCTVWGVYSVGCEQCGVCTVWGVYSVGCVQCEECTVWGTVVIRSTIPKKRALNAGDRVRTYVPCAYSQLHAVISTIILYATFLVTAKTRTDISLRKSSTECRRSI